MALISLGRLLHFISLVLALLFIYTASSSSKTQAKAAVPYANQICPKTRNPTYCYQNLGSYKKLSDLASGAILLAERNAGFAEAEFRDALNRDIDPPVLLKRYVACYACYDHAMGYLAQTNNLLKLGSYNALPSAASATIAKEKACDQVFATPPRLEDSFRRQTEPSQDAASIVFVVSQMLAAGVR